MQSYNDPRDFNSYCDMSMDQLNAYKAQEKHTGHKDVAESENSDSFSYDEYSDYYEYDHINGYDDPQEPKVEEKKVEEKKVIPVVIAPWANVKHTVVSLRDNFAEEELKLKQGQDQVKTKTPEVKQAQTEKSKNEQTTYYSAAVPPSKLIRDMKNKIKKDEIEAQQSLTLPNFIHETPSPIEEVAKSAKSVKKRFCNVVLSGKKCLHQECKFAHNLQELKPDKCNVNCSDSRCKYLHNNETIDSYYNRFYGAPSIRILNINCKDKQISDVDKATKDVVTKFPTSPYLKTVVEVVRKVKLPTNNDTVKGNDYEHLKKTKFCQNVIDTGKCLRNSCTYAHKLSELVFPKCSYAEKCKKSFCNFFHPAESIESYKSRVNFKLPPNMPLE
jgi:hypothetical protein